MLKLNGGKLDGTATPTKVESGTTINYAAGKNLTVKQDISQSTGEQTYTYSLNKDLKEITSITNNGGTTMNFGPNNISITGGNLDLGDNNITNLKSVAIQSTMLLTSAMLSVSPKLKIYTLHLQQALTTM